MLLVVKARCIEAHQATHNSPPDMITMNDHERRLALYASSVDPMSKLEKCKGEVRMIHSRYLEVFILNWGEERR
jgi:hypothetical protein